MILYDHASGLEENVQDGYFERPKESSFGPNYIFDKNQKKNDFSFDFNQMKIKENNESKNGKNGKN